ncbi:MAG: hypothetical protein CMF29_00135 [Kiritimatiellaceae bacterium]|nr:hypothetical protein [Kiritimatiellaceae bacterium]
MASKVKEIQEPDSPEYMELVKLYDDTGELTAKGVVNKARNPKSALHSCFEWDDSVAGEKFREAQAYRLINRYQIKVVRTGEDIPVPMKAFMMPESGSGSGAAQSHHPSVVVLDDDWKYSKQLVRLETKLLNLQQEIDGFVELKSVSTAIKKYFSRQ